MCTAHGTYGEELPTLAVFPFSGGGLPMRCSTSIAVHARQVAQANTHLEDEELIEKYYGGCVS